AGPSPVRASWSCSKRVWSRAYVSPGGSAMPLLTLCDPGSCASVGVSKPVGASVGPCCATPATTIASAPRAKTGNEIHLRNIGYLRNRLNLVRSESEHTVRQRLHSVQDRATRAFIP